MTPRVSVLCTVYNAAEHLEDALRSVVEQTFTDWELLVCDDGSTDERVYQTFLSVDDPRIVYDQANPTPEQRAASVRYATNINRMARYATGEYLTYLAGDDAYLPTRLERMVATLDALRLDGDHAWRNQVVYGAQQLVGDTRGIRHTRGVLTDAYGIVDLNSVMHTRAAFDRVGGWQDTPPTPELWRTADGYFWRRLTDAGYVFTPVAGGPTDVKRYRPGSVDQRVIAGFDPWT